MKQNIYIIGGGTLSYVRTHLALCTPAFGATAQDLTKICNNYMWNHPELHDRYNIITVLTKMADSSSPIKTNEDVSQWIDEIIKDPATRAVIFNVALTDFDGQIGDIESSMTAPRLESRKGLYAIELSAADKLIGKIRKHRKDIFVVGFKTTSGADHATQYAKGLKLLKDNSINLVLANDVGTRKNIIIVPEESHYGSDTDSRERVLEQLVEMMFARIENTFTRSLMVPGESIDWNGELVPAGLRAVVNHCIEEGAYKPFMGKTVGHFAVKVDSTTILTSKRKTNFNELDEVGLVKIESIDADRVRAYGAKPSVGGQSQRIIFKEHEDADCIAHFHCPMLDNPRDDIPIAPQWQNECGSHECGQNTSDNLKLFDLGDGDFLKAVFLEEHGPNIVFSRNTDSSKVIDFINANFDLSNKTGGVIPEYALS